MGWMIFNIPLLLIACVYITLSLFPEIDPFTHVAKNGLRKGLRKTVCYKVPPMLLKVGRLVRDLVSSMAFDILSNLAWYIYGVYSVFQDRHYGHESMTPEQILLENQWGFGQLVPMFLIALCLVAALEICSSKCHTYIFPRRCFPFAS